MLKLGGLYIFSLLFFIGAGVFVAKRKHLLAILLSLEFIVLCLYSIIYFSFSGYGVEYYFVIVFLTFAVCEGALGLGILVSIIRTHGNDYFQRFRILQC
jgi:NADH-ubiquinone oxidoreductase chain 4L